MTMNGGSVLAMAGKHSVAVVVDKRFAKDNALISVSPRPVLVPSSDPNTMVVFTGLDSDILTFRYRLEAQLARLQGIVRPDTGCCVPASSVARLTSHLLYQQRARGAYFVEPLVVGWDTASSSTENNNKPYLCSLDMIGAMSVSHSFCCAGAATESLYGTASALWKEHLEDDELVTVCGRAFMSALERDCLSGYGAVLYLIGRDRIVEYDLAGRND